MSIVDKLGQISVLIKKKQFLIHSFPSSETSVCRIKHVLQIDYRPMHVHALSLSSLLLPCHPGFRSTATEQCSSAVASPQQEFKQFICLPLLSRGGSKAALFYRQTLTREHLLQNSNTFCLFVNRRSQTMFFFYR